MKTASSLSCALSLIAAAGVSLTLLHGVATLPEATPAGAHGPVIAQTGGQVASLAPAAAR